MWALTGNDAGRSRPDPGSRVVGSAGRRTTTMGSAMEKSVGRSTEHEQAGDGTVGRAGPGDNAPTPAEPAPAGPTRDELEPVIARIDHQLSRRGPGAGGNALDDWTPSRRRRLIDLWLSDVDPFDVSQGDPVIIAELIRAHLDLGHTRQPGSTVTDLFTPNLDRDGWDDHGRTVVLVVTDDRPFLVDTLTMTITGRGWDIHEVSHPQFSVRRDTEGHLVEVDDLTAGPASDALAESWIFVEVTPPLGQSIDVEADALHAAIDDGLFHVQIATDDFPAMLERLGEAQHEVARSSCPAGGRDAVAEFLAWLADGNFTLLGSCEHRFVDGGYQPVPGTGLGIRRDSPGRFDAVPLESPPQLLVITHDSDRSTVHRPSWLDYVGVRRFDSGGRLIGESRFVGLFGSTVHAESVWRIPMVRDKAAEIVRLSGHLPGSHSAAQLRSIIETYPREELLHAQVPELSAVMRQVGTLRERRQLRLFARPGRWGRFVSFLVYFPRDRYNTDVRHQMTAILMHAVGGESIEYQVQVSESVLARLYFTVRLPDGQSPGRLDLGAIEQQLVATMRSWEDEFVELVGDLSTARRGIEFPEGYRGDYPAAEGVADLMALNEVTGPGDIRFRTRVPGDADDPSDLRVKMFRVGATMRLSEVMPHLTSLGFRVIDERPYELELRGAEAMVYDFGLGVPDRGRRLTPADHARYTDAFVASYLGRVPADDFSALVTATDLSWRQVALLRAIAGYLQQLGSPYSASYVARALLANPQLAVDLVAMFEVRFNPDLFHTHEARNQTWAERRDALIASLDHVESLDHDRIMRQFVSVIAATDRTNWYCALTPFQRDTAALALKMRPGDIDIAPSPRPVHEIYVNGPLVEGVHLRFADVARGGIRWSDRPEDFRTEVLGLAKAQTVKNSVIVPSGAKGGFVPRRLPDPADRAAWQAAGIEAYACFISSLLSLTDSIDASGSVVPPERVVRHDGDDPYLVVAADKGTATFSDIANTIASEHGFWLGDAFASGGSVGYDHKAMGITARGAWESVKRHFRELGLDCQATDFTCVGIGDMSGDVFGNGMLLSRHIRLVAAFNHMHIFLDPDPDPEVSFAERRRLFDLPRSSWSDYNPELISAGGGVHPRTAKSIPINDAVRDALGIEPGVTAMTPTQLISTILRAPVDLLWNGGIGTYVKAADESHADAGDRTNDAVRVDGAKVRARVAGEGGNLGWTQRGRIEYARRGGCINTDFIDNSAGVDTSDHEVNIKILLAAEVAAGRLTMSERDALLPTMADEVARLVLAHNIDQNDALSDAVAGASASAGVHEMWMERLEEAGYLDRRLDEMPGRDEMARRIASGEGLTNPELAMLLSWTKIWMRNQILASDLPEDPFVADRLIGYFPSVLQERYRDQMPNHRLHREIITTVAVNRYVHSQGITAYHRRSEVTGADPAQVVRAQLAARSIFSAGRIEVMTARAGVPASVRTGIRADTRHLVDQASRILLRDGNPLDIRATIDRYAPLQAELTGLMPDMLDAASRAGVLVTRERLTEAGVPGDVASLVALSPVLHETLSIIDIAGRTGTPAGLVAGCWFGLTERLGLRDLRARIDRLPRRSKWEIMARASLQDELYAITEDLAGALVARTSGDDPAVRVDGWVAGSSRFATVASLVASTGDEQGLAPLSVAVRTLHTLV